MNRKRNIWLVGGVVVLIAALVSAFVVMQPSAKDILTQTLETAKTIDDVHAVIEVKVDSPEQKVTATVEFWGSRVENGPGAFRLEVLDTDMVKAAGMVVVSDGETIWAYSPSEGKVFTGTADEAREMMADKQPMTGGFDKEKFEHPETAEEAVDKLLEYVKAERTGTETVGNASAHLLELKPIAEQMPAEYAAIGGFINLWIDTNRSLPLAVAYSGGSIGEVNITAMDLEVNQGVDASLFTFEIPAGVEVVRFADLEPQSLSLDEAAASVDFDFLTPAETPAGATLVDVLDIRGAVVQRYTLSDGGSFSIAQGQLDETPKPATEAQAVEVRGFSGSLFVSEGGDQVLLTWTEGGVFFYVAGDISTDQALAIAESLQ